MVQPEPNPRPNLARLQTFVGASLERAASRDAAAAVAGLRRDAERVAQQLRALSAWAANAHSPEPPAHLAGLSAFDLSDAVQALEAEAWRRQPRIRVPA